MQQYCPNCQAAFSGTPRCPRCDGLLFMPHEAADHMPSDAAEPHPGFVRTTPSGRIVLGTILALGLYLGLRKLIAAAVLASTPDPAAWWVSMEGLVAVFGAQGVAALFGALVAGAGRAHGFALGVAVGGLSGGMFLAAEVLAGTPAAEMVLYLQPPTLALASGVAAAIGTRVWPALPDLDIRPPAKRRSSSIQLAVDEPQKYNRPTLWVRVLAGAAIMVVGVVAADQVRTGVQKRSGGLFHVENIIQGQFLSWQFATFVVLLGGVVAASGSGAGIRHGFLAGVLGAAGTAALTVNRGEINPAMEYWLSKLALPGGATEPAALLGIGMGVLLAAVVGGWLGGQVFLPLAPAHMRSRRLKMSD
jgi:hypothetical protein